MKKEFLNIWIHDDKRLEKLMKGKIISREKLHQWPLSYVEKVALDNNAQFVYKSQNSDSSVEKEFYSKIKMPFLTSPTYFETYENCDIMVFPYLDYPKPENVSEIELEQIVLKVNRMIQGISDMPVFFDLSSAEKLTQIIDTVSVCFDERGRSHNISLLKKWVFEKSHTCYDNQETGNVHGDLSMSNILIDNDELRYILDWQRPMKAPILLENALAFRLAGYDAIKRYSDFGILALICHFIWYSYACINFMPFVFDIAEKLLLEFVSFYV